MENIYYSTYSKEFIKKWKNILKELYFYEEYMDFLIVPSIFGKKTLVYLPLLNYTDKLNDNIDDLLELAKDNNYQIRVLNPSYSDFKKNDTVTMRLSIDNDMDTIFNKYIKSKCRNQIRKAKKGELLLKVGNEKELIDDFYNLFTLTMHRHGTPTFDKKLFTLIADKLNANFFVVYKDKLAISALILIEDEDIAFVPWGASDNNFSKYCPSNLMYFEAINFAVKNGKKFFDFGRSSYEGNTYKFKLQWGAKPIKIDILKSKKEDIYSKYSSVSKVWEKLPKVVVDKIGPKICKYLDDL